MSAHPTGAWTTHAARKPADRSRRPRHRDQVTALRPGLAVHHSRRCGLRRRWHPDSRQSTRSTTGECDLPADDRNTAPRATRQNLDRQRTPPAPDPDGLFSSFQHRATTPHTRAARPRPKPKSDPTSDRPRRLAGAPKTNPRRAHLRAPPRDMIELRVATCRSNTKSYIRAPQGPGPSQMRPTTRVAVLGGDRVQNVQTARSRYWVPKATTLIPSMSPTQWATSSCRS